MHIDEHINSAHECFIKVVPDDIFQLVYIYKYIINILLVLLIYMNHLSLLYNQYIIFTEKLLFNHTLIALIDHNINVSKIKYLMHLFKHRCCGSYKCS